MSFYNSVASLAIRLTLDLLLIRVWGMVGAATAAGLVVAAMSIVRLLETYRLLRFWPYDRTFVKPVIAGGVALAAGLAMNRLGPANLNLFYLILDVAVLWSIYAATIMLLGISEEDRLVISRIKGRLDAMLFKHKGSQNDRPSVGS